MGKVALILMGVVFLFSGALSAGEAEARVVKRWKTDNGYQCHKHNRHIKREKGTDWSSHKDRKGRARVHCHKVKRKHRSGSSAWVLPRYVVMCESGGNPRVVNRTAAGAANGYPAGLYQITGPTWRAYGGARFAPSADRASVYEQGVIAKRVLANQGPRAWACW